MRRHEAEFLQRIRAAFEVEAHEHLQILASGLLALERGPELDPEQLETVFRHTHSLKGAARAAGFHDIEAVCQALEAVFVLARRRQLPLQASHYDLLHRGFDLVAALVEAGTQPTPPDTAQRLRALVQQLESLAMVTSAPQGAVAARAPMREDSDAPPAAAHEPVTRVATPDLDRLLRSVEEMLAVKHAGFERTRQLREIAQGFGEWNKQWLAVQSGLRQQRRGAQQSGARSSPEAQVAAYVDWAFGYVRALEDKVAALSKTFTRDQELVGRQVDDLMAQSRDLLMAPFSLVAELMPKMVRDLARSQDKQAELVVRGGDVRIDKRLLDQMKDPIIHLLRNAVDHGVEPSAEREAEGKPARAQIELSARFVSGDKIELRVQDDGRGLDVQAIRQAAVRGGLVEAQDAAQIDEAQALDLAFRPDVSTSPIITELSGRGVGLAIVRELVEKLGGQVSVRNLAAGGACFQVVLPQSLGALRGLFVRVGERGFVLPSLHVDGVARVPFAEVRTVRNRETVTRAGQVVSLLPLGDLLALPGYRGLEDAQHVTAVFLEAGNERLALAVDEILDDEEVLVKRLEPPLLRLRNIAGATVTAAGGIVPILNVADLIKTARQRKVGSRCVAAPADLAARNRRARILLAEDSITSRLLLKGILESAGYDVATAVDGIEAFTALRSQPFDLLVSDIEMPRLGGFDLTARVRADAVLSALPVVLVTALARKEDRERGIDVGANAYITKGSFDQRDLLEAVRRLVSLQERA